MRTKIKVSSPGKIIISGEHSVVYGYPALLGAINKRLSISLEKIKDKKDIIVTSEPEDLARYGINKLKTMLNKADFVMAKIDSEIPVSRGMGSSAALATALAGAMLIFAEKIKKELDIINQYAYEIEKRQHGNPSGADNTASLYGGLLSFLRKSDGNVFEKIKPKKIIKTILIDSGQALESTGEMVTRVKEMVTMFPRKTKSILKEMGEVTKCFLKLMAGENEYNFDELLRENEKLLENLNVVSPKAKKIIREIESLGGGAKITGAGGIKSGSGIIIAHHNDQDVLFNFIKQNQLPFYEVRLGEAGFRLEK